MASRDGFVAVLAKVIAHTFYRIDAIGEVPARGPLLLLPNHPNALLDPALVIATAGRPVRFLAKSTLFRGPLGLLVRGAGAIPVYRRQDAAEVAKNTETFAAVESALKRGEAVCVFPEGISHSTGQLEALRTGAARMALSAAAAGVPVRLVPVGINLDRKASFRSAAAVAYGPAFEPAATEPRALTAQIAAHMRALIVEADPHADAALVERVERLYRAERPETGAEAILQRKRAIANGMRRLRAERPDWYDDALIQFRRYDDRLRRFGLDDEALAWGTSRRAALRFLARELPAAIVFLPVAAIATVVFALPYALTAAAAKLSRHLDLTATTKVFAGIVLYGGWTVALAVIAGGVLGMAAGVATLVGVPLLAAAGLFAIERETAAWRTAASWLALRAARPSTREALKRRRAELADILDAVNDWLRT